MIISASRRTDIPAFFSEWFINRINEGYCINKNPYSGKEYKTILTPNTVDCIVFWTKECGPMLNKVNKLSNYAFYFQHTINPYDNEIETNVRNKKLIIEDFKKMSDKIGKERMIWRYDPILINEKYTAEKHIKLFEEMANELSGKTESCVFSFVDMYAKTINNTKCNSAREPNREEMEYMAEQISKIAQKNNITLKTCSEQIDLSKYKIEHNKCIDDKLIERITGKKLFAEKDSWQRAICGCVKSQDIGMYNTCTHGCTYCYANKNKSQAIEMAKQHNPKSPYLIG